MIYIDAKVNTAKLVAGLDDAARNQIPFATALTLTRVGKAIKDRMPEEMAQRFSEPTRFTLRSVFLDRATKRKLQARVWFKDWAAKGTPAATYLQPQVIGERRRHKRFEKALFLSGQMLRSQYAIPGDNAPLNKHGNLTGAFVSNMLNQLKANVADPLQHSNFQNGRKKRTRGRIFVMRREGTPIGVYRRRGKRIDHILSFTTDQPDYRQRLPFFEISQRMTGQLYDREFALALNHALATAKR